MYEKRELQPKDRNNPNVQLLNWGKDNRDKITTEGNIIVINELSVKVPGCLV